MNRELRNRAALIALTATVLLTALKLIAAFISGSVGVFSEGVHSFLDVISAGVSVVTVRQAIKPADDDHPFGHGKIETISSLFEAILLILAAVLICYEGVDHWHHPQEIRYTGFAIAVTSVSILVSYIVYRHNLSASHATESSALRVNALHFLSDVVASIGVLFALVIMKWTGWWEIDPITAFLVAGYILFVSAQQVKHALLELSDIQLPPAEIKRIAEIIQGFHGQIIDSHDLRTRRSGSVRHIDFHLTICGVLTVNASHDVCDRIEEKIMEEFPGSSVTIHVEPCASHKPTCDTVCESFQKTPQEMHKH